MDEVCGIINIQIHTFAFYYLWWETDERFYLCVHGFVLTDWKWNENCLGRLKWLNIEIHLYEDEGDLFFLHGVIQRKEFIGRIWKTPFKNLFVEKSKKIKQ